MSPFWQGFLLFPFAAIIVGFLVWITSRISRSFISWYLGLPPVRWLAMCLFSLGLKFMSGKHCRVRRADGRLWVSPLVDRFVDDEAGR